MSETERIAQGLIDRSLPKTEWTHHAHLRAGLWHVLTLGPDEALERLRERIRAYNEHVGTANTDSSGYHETITRFYVGLITHFVSTERAVGGAEDLDVLAQRLIAQHGDRELPLRFYSRKRLFSREARREWMAPDLRPLGF